MSKRNAPTDSISPDEVIALADCRYCKRPRGSKCRDKVYTREMVLPHRSRVARAVRERERVKE